MNSGDRTRLDRVERKVDEIKDNHLPHIYEELGKHSGLLKILVPLVIGIGVLVLGLYFKGGW